MRPNSVLVDHPKRNILANLKLMVLRHILLVYICNTHSRPPRSPYFDCVIPAALRWTLRNLGVSDFDYQYVEYIVAHSKVKGGTTNAALESLGLTPQHRIRQNWRFVVALADLFECVLDLIFCLRIYTIVRNRSKDCCWPRYPFVRCCLPSVDSPPRASVVVGRFHFITSTPVRIWLATYNCKFSCWACQVEV